MIHNTLRILLIGADGRLGKEIDLAAKEVSDCIIAGRIGSPRQTHLPSDITPFLPLIDAVLDVSTPLALEKNLPLILAARRPLVIGTTGQNSHQLQQIEEARKVIPILLRPNFSLGIALLKKILPDFPDGDYQIIETHHAGKKDAPSGTALQLATLLKTKPPITSIREGAVLGEHKIILNLPHETIEIKHIVSDRKVFAFGAIAACKELIYEKKELSY